MSDDFDREAERERLREKYERDKAKREATEQMSELLLQGATMTNRHCPECHSPVFRYDGREFCPTCQREVAEDGEFVGEEAGAEAGGGAADAAANGEGAAADQADAAGEASAEDPAAGDEPAAGGPAGGDATGAPADAAGESTDAGATGGAEERRADAREERSGRASADRPDETRPATAPERRPARVDPPARREEPGRHAAGEGGDLREAEAALVREITALTRRAEETRDVGRKRDLFAAAREATETLRELRRL